LKARYQHHQPLSLLSDFALLCEVTPSVCKHSDFDSDNRSVIELVLHVLLGSSPQVPHACQDDGRHTIGDAV
jgi:hypothetical protein